MSKCLRCGATSEWIQGRVPDEIPSDPDVDLRAKYASAVRTLQQAATMVDWWEAKKLCAETLTQLGEPVEAPDSGSDVCR